MTDAEIIVDLSNQIRVLDAKLQTAMKALEWITSFGNNKDMKRLADRTIEEIRNIE